MGGDSPTPLIRGLLKAEAYPHPVSAVTRIETHISHVLLTGDFVYKLKKPVDLGFVDYTTLERRHYFCQEELRLNRRLAPHLYLDVVAITGSPDAPRVGGDGPVIDYAVKMRAFKQEDQWDHALADGRLTAEHLTSLADTLARFHERVAVARPGDGLGGPEQVRAALMANFELTRRFVPNLIDAASFARLESWTDEQLTRLSGTIRARLADGFVRECHGDVHLQNVAFVGDEVVLFDCIEFNPAFRFVDVMAEIAFTVMDLDSRGRSDLGTRFLNRYLEIGGDYAGLQLLPMYLSYRAYVRAKVTALSPAAPGQGERISGLISLAEGYTCLPRASIVVMHGVTASGKSTVSTALLDRLRAIRIRSDVERKRLAGVPRETRPGDELPKGTTDGDIYDASSTDATYERLRDMAVGVVETGFSVILDATYIHRAARQAVRELGERLGVPVVIVSCQASESVLTERLSQRAAQSGGVSDGTVRVLQSQLQVADALDAGELETAIVFDTEKADYDALAAQLTLALQGEGPHG